MANKIILKKSSVVGKIPTEEDLDYGEIALNFNDGRLYFKNNLDQIEFFEKNAGFVSDFTVLANDLDGGNVTTGALNFIDLGLVSASTTSSYDLGSLTISGLIFPTQLVLPSFTTESLPPTSPSAQLAFLSDDEGGASIIFSDGTNWRRVSDQSIIS